LPPPAPPSPHRHHPPPSPPQCDDHDFRDGSLFYRFFADEDDEAQADRFFAAPTLDLPTFARPSPRVPRLVRAPRSGGTDLPSWRVPSHVSCNSPITGLAISDALQWAVGTDDPLATAWCLGVMRRRARFLALSRPGTRKQIQRSAAARAASLPAASRRADPSTTPDYLWQPFPAEDPWEEIKTGDAGSGAERTRVWRLGGERVHQVYRAETIVDASLGDARLCIASLPNRAVWDTASEEPRVVGRVKADRRALEAATWEQPGSSERDIDAAGVRAARSETSSSSAVSSTAPPATVASMGVDTASSSSRAESEADGLGPLVTLPVPRRAGRTGAPSGPASRSAERAEARQTAVRDHARLVRLIGASEVLRILEGAVGYSTQAGPGGGAAAAAAGWGTGGGSDRGRAGSETSGVSVDRDDGAGSGGAGSGRTPDVTSPGPALAADVAGRTGREDEPLLHETMGRVLRRLFGSGAPATAPAPAAESPPREVAASHARRAAASAAAPSPSRGGRPPVVGAGAGRAESAAPGLRHHPAVPLCLESDAAGAGGDGSPEDADDDTGSQEAKSVESGPAAVGSDLRRPPVRPRLASEAAAAAASGAGGGGGVVLGRDLSVSGRDSSTASSSRSSAAGASSWGMGEGRDDDEIVLTALAGGRAGRSAAVAPDTGGFGMDTDGEDDEAAPGAAGADSRRRLERYASARRRCFPRIVRRGMRALSVFVAARDAVTIQDAHAGAVLVGDDDRALAGPPGRASSGNRAASGSSVRSDTSSLGAAPPRLPDAATPFFVHLEVSVQHRSHRKPESSRDVRAEVVLECWSFFDVSGGGVGSDQAGGPRTLVVLTTCLFPGALPIWMSRTVLDAQTIGPVERLRGALRMLSMARKRKGARPATGGSGAPAAPPAPVSREASLADTDGAPRSVPGTDAHMAERRTASNAWANPFHASSPGMGSALASPGSRSDLGRSSAQSSAGQTGVASTAGRRAAAEVLARFAEATTSSESDLGSDSGSDEEHRRRRGDEDDEDDEAEAEAEASLPGRTGLGGKRRSRAARSLVSSLRSDSRGQASPFPPAAAEAAAAAGAAPAAPVLPTAAAPAAPARAPRLTDFKVLAVLGRGGYGKVMQVLHKPSGAVLAMKVLRKSALVRRGQVARTLNERDILASASHPFVVGMRCAMQTSRKLYLCMDFVPGGDFFTLLSRRGAVPERRARVYVAELVLALAYLHSRGVVYRDLKPENVLLDADGHIALTDFGLSRLPVRRTASALPLGICKGKGSDREPAPTPDPSPDDPEAVAAAALVAGLAPGLVTRSVGPLDPSYSFCGTEQYMAPEVLLQSGHACTADWWSLGVFVSGEARATTAPARARDATPTPHPASCRPPPRRAPDRAAPVPRGQPLQHAAEHRAPLGAARHARPRVRGGRLPPRRPPHARPPRPPGQSRRRRRPCRDPAPLVRRPRLARHLQARGGPGLQAPHRLRRRHLPLRPGVHQGEPGGLGGLLRRRRPGLRAPEDARPHGGRRRRRRRHRRGR